MNAKKYLLSWASHYLGVVRIYQYQFFALSIAFIVPLCASRIFLTNSFIDLSIFLGSKQLTFYLFAVSFICHNSQVLVYVNDKAPTLLTLSLLREVRIRGTVRLSKRGHVISVVDYAGRFPPVVILFSLFI